MQILQIALVERVGMCTFRSVIWTAADYSNIDRVRIYPVGGFSYFISFRKLIQHSLRHSVRCLGCIAFECLPRNLMSLLKYFVAFLSSGAQKLE